MLFILFCLAFIFSPLLMLGALNQCDPMKDLPPELERMPFKKKR